MQQHHHIFLYLLLFVAFWIVLQVGIYYLKKLILPRRLPFNVGLESVTPQQHVAMRAWWDKLPTDKQYEYQDDIFTAWRSREQK